MLYTNLINSNLVILNETTIGINFVNELNPFSLSVLNKEENINYIKNEISMIVGREIKIKYLCQGEEIKDNKAEEELITFDDSLSFDDSPFEIIR